MRFKLALFLAGIIFSGLSCTYSHQSVCDNKASIVIHPKNEYESKEEFNSRLNAQKISSVQIPPKNAYESKEEFYSRLDVQKTCRVVIPPKNKHESKEEFTSRLSAHKDMSHKE